MRERDKILKKNGLNYKTVNDLIIWLLIYLKTDFLQR